MHEGGARTWREVMDKYHSALVDDLAVSVDSDVRDAVSRAIVAERSQAGIQLKRECDDARRAQVESLNQVLRRLRTTGEDRILELAAESCASYAEKVVVLVFESNQARCAASAGIENSIPAFDTDSAPAIVAAIDSRDPVAALATEAEISPVLSAALGDASLSNPDRKAYLFPVVARHTVVAMLIVSAGAPAPQCAPIELLCEAAGMRLEACAPQPGAGLAPPTKGVGADPASGPRAWEDLTVEDQKLHLQAQRMARVRVAEVRLYHESDLRNGIARGDIYATLQTAIDTAREEFLHSFLSKSPTMVDYLHLEILRSLAHDDDRVLGGNYPGPMV
jgi:hypothetical protein